MEHQQRCRFCQTPLDQTFVDLGMLPLCEDHERVDQMNRMEPFYPLHAYVCKSCLLVQLDDQPSPSEAFSNQAYFSSYSDQGLVESHKYAARISEMLTLNEHSLVAEMTGSDGYLLQYYVDNRIPVLGIEPFSPGIEVTSSTPGTRTEKKFFGLKSAIELSAKYGKPNLLIGNRVISQVSDINDYVSGLKAFLGVEGVLTLEFSHLLRMVEKNQFDAISHEHVSYLSFTTIDKILRYHGLTTFCAEELATRGGSLRVYAQHREDTTRRIDDSVYNMLQQEREAGIHEMSYYANFERNVRATKMKILEFFIEAKSAGKRIVAYGTAGKGNTLLNYCGVRTDFVDFTVDRDPRMQGGFLPGTLIPVRDPMVIKETKPDYIFILPGSRKDDIIESMSFIHEWGGKFVVPIPELKVLDSRWLLHRYKRAS